MIMKKSLSIFSASSKKLKLLLFLIAVVFSVWTINQSSFLRWFGYETIPTPIIDEFTYVWQGLSLRSTGLPVSYVTDPYVYKNSKFNSRGGNIVGFGVESEGSLIDLTKFKKDPRPVIAVKEINYVKGLEQILFVAPVFEHPPLGGLIYSLGEDKNIKEVEQVEAATFRTNSLIIAIITSVLLFIFLYIITLNSWTALLGVIIYSTVPTYLLATRTAFLENIEPPFILTHLILLFFSLQAYKKGLDNILIYSLIILSGLLGGLGVLAKEPAAGFLIGSLILIVINKVPKKLTILFLLSSAIPILLYLSWGLLLQKDLFLSVLYANSNKSYFGALKPVTMLEALKFKNFPVDGWWIWGFLSFIFISQNIKQRNILYLIIPLFTHFVTVLLLPSANYPWYLISMIPFLAGCSAIAIWQIYENPNIVKAYTFFFIAFSSSYYWGRVALNIQPSMMHYRWTFIVFTIMLALRLIFQKNKIIGFIWFLFLAILIQKIVTFNQVFFPYLVAHWGNLPVPSLPNF